MSKTYDVDVSARVWTTITVEADSEEEAQQKALEEFDIGDCEVLEVEAENAWAVDDDNDEDEDGLLSNDDDKDDYLYDEEDDD